MGSSHVIWPCAIEFNVLSQYRRKETVYKPPFSLMLCFSFLSCSFLYIVYIFLAAECALGDLWYCLYADGEECDLLTNSNVAPMTGCIFSFSFAFTRPPPPFLGYVCVYIEKSIGMRHCMEPAKRVRLFQLQCNSLFYFSSLFLVRFRAVERRRKKGPISFRLLCCGAFVNKEKSKP